MMALFLIFTAVIVLWVRTYVNTHQTIHGKQVWLTICRLHLKKAAFYKETKMIKRN